MIHLYNKDKIKLAGLINYTNLTIEHELESGEKTLSFSYPKTSKYYFDIQEESYIRTKENEFIVKEKTVHSDYTDFKCILNLEDLEGKPWERFASEEQPIDKALSLALAGTGWIVGKCSLKRKRTVRKSNCSSLEVIQDIRKTYRCDLVFNTINRTIDVYESLGEDKGTYFIDSLNLKDLSIQGNSYDFFTRIIPIGKDDLKISNINNNKEYVENYQYSKKIKTCYWKDDRYTVVENLKEDAEAKLNEISKPYKSYSADIINLAKLNNKYKNILDYKLGDTVYIVSKNDKFRDKQRIVKITEHPDEHELDTVELANTTLSFEDIQTQFKETSDTVDNITTDNGTIDGSTVDNIETKQISDFEANVIKVTKLTAINAKIYNLEAQNVTITGDLNAVKATIGTLEVNVATIDKITVTNTALINDLQANKASITQLEAINANVKILEADVGNIETLVNGNLSSKNLQAGSITARELASNAITAGSTVIGEGAIGNAQISNLDATKLNAGTIDTSLITIAGSNSNLKLKGNRLQVFVGIGSNQIERVSLGDVNGDGSVYGFRVRGSDGKTILIDENGVKSEGITNGSITNDKINSNANIDGAKLNINSVVTKINGATTSILGTKIDINGTNLLLKLSQQDTTITEHKKTIDSHTTSIEANTNAIKLKVDNQTYITDKTNFTNTLNKATSDISLLRGQISLKVEQSDITNAIDNIEIGSANLVNNSAILQNLFSQINTYKGNRTVIDDNLALSNKCVKFECTNGGTGFHMPLFPKTTEKIGNVYTWSFWAKCSVVKSGNVGHESGGQKNITITTEWKRFEHTWKFTDSQYSSFTFYQGWNTGEILYIRDFQIVKGNKVGDWSPSISDIQNDMDTKVSTAKAEIKITTDAITQNISNLTTTVNNKADGSLVTSLNNKVSSLETSLNGIKGEVSSLETTTTTINTKVDKAQVDATKGINDAKTANDKATSAQNAANTNKDNITNLTTEVTTVKSNVATLDVNIKGITQRVSSTETSITAVTTTANNANNQANANKTELTKTNNKVASIETNLTSITSRVSTVETTTSNINGTVTNLSTRMSSAEQKITDSAIVSTVTKSYTYINDLNGKVSSNTIISSINQTAEAIKINASRIELNGVTTAGNLSGGRYVKIENETYTAYNNNIKVLEQGVRDWSGRLVPAMYMGSDGFKSGSTGIDGTYFAMFNFPSINGNPSFQHLGLRNARTGLWSVIEFNDQGVMAIRPEMNLNISGPELHLLSTNIYLEGRTHFTQVMDCRHIDCAGIRVGASAKFPFGAVFDDQGRTAIQKAPTGDDLGVLTTCLYPKFTGVQYLGNTAFRWRQLYCTTAPDISSDISLKENIVYTDEKSIVPQLEYLYDSDNLTYKDMYDFYKDIYRSAEYNYIGDENKVIGIIANDIANTKVGKKIVNLNEDGKLSYSLETRVTVSEGALKQAILEIEQLKEEIKQLRAS